MTQTDVRPGRSVIERARSLALAAWTRSVQPSRLTLRRQLALGLGAYLAIFLVLVVTGINGSSMGLLYTELFGGRDPRVLAGSPRGVRSDEWLVVTPLTVAQVQQGLPRVSDLFPGGFDASIVWDLPYRDWSVLLRPHMWGFFFLPLDNAYAVKWWLPFFVLMAVLFALLCVLWRRPLAAFAVAGAFGASPFFQWWFGPGSFWPPACALAACLGVIVLLRTERAWLRWLTGAGVAYLVAVAVVGLYPPYLIPALYPAIGFCVGWVCLRSVLSWPERLRRIAPLGVGAVVVGAVVLLYLRTRADAVEAVLSTVYPGQRLTPTGFSQGFPTTAMYAGVFGAGLEADPTGFAPNASEGSSFLFLGLFLVPSALWLVWSRYRRGRGVDGPLVGVLASLALLMAFIYVPGWDAVAHLLFLDRVVQPRTVIGLGVASIMLLALVVARLREEPELRVPWWTTVAVAVLVLVPHAVVYLRLRDSAPAVLDAARAWPLLVILLTAAMVLFSRGRATLPGVLVACVALVVGGTVNPLYRGVLDLRETEIGRAIDATDEADPGTWVAVGGLGATSILRESGVEAVSGVQAWPSDEMWEALDPDGSEEASWNRYAHVNWTADPAAPDLVLVQNDVLQVRLDSCGDFAQRNLDHVLSSLEIDQPCLEKTAEVTEGRSTFFLYRVVPPAAG